MGKYLITLVLVLSATLQGQWHDDWATAVKMCQDMNYTEAEIKFSNCLKEIEAKNDESGIHVYVDRARLYLIQERYEEALVDLNIAIKNPNLEKKELTRALVSRICANSNLGKTESILEDLSLFSTSLPASQEVNFTEKYITIRNAPDSACFRNIVSNFFINAGFCQSINDIKILNSGIWIIEREDKGPCECDTGKFNPIEIDTKPTNCLEWCDYFAIAGAAWCTKAFKRYDCQVGCLAAVEMIKRNICYRCCRDGGIYKNCIKPFEDIVSYMGNPCDPMWD